MSNPYGGHTVFVHLLHMGPMWAAHMGSRSCPQFCPYGPHTIAVHMFHMGPMWVANMQYGSHVGCPYGSQILTTFSRDLARISTHMSPIRVLFTCHPMWVANVSDLIGSPDALSSEFEEAIAMCQSHCFIV